MPPVIPHEIPPKITPVISSRHLFLRNSSKDFSSDSFTNFSGFPPEISTANPSEISREIFLERSLQPFLKVFLQEFFLEFLLALTSGDSS